MEEWKRNAEGVAGILLPGDPKSLKGGAGGIVYPLFSLGRMSASAGIYRIDESKGYNYQLPIGDNRTKIGLILQFPL